MVSSKSFRKIVIRVLLIAVNATVLGLLTGVYQYYITSTFLGILLVIQIGELVHYSGAVQRELALVFSAIRNSDFAFQFRTDPKDHLHAEMNAVIESFRKVKIEREQQFQFLEMLVDSLFTGILSFDNNGRIQLYNRKARELLDTPALTHWNSLEKKVPEFCKSVLDMKAGEQRLLEISITGFDLVLSLYRDQIKLGDELHTLVSFQNIAPEVEQKELDAYQKLIRILTHEIMNSVTPMISISDTLLEITRQAEMADPTGAADLQSGLEAIHERSLGILKFVEDYRSLIALPEPQKEAVFIDQIVDEAIQLFRVELSNRGVAISRKGDEPVKIMADAGQMKQVFINLITNSKQALDGVSGGEIEIDIRQGVKEVSIRITDNGPGIPPEKLDRIFIPFFSTKPSGSGVGLSLARTIIHRHQGRIRVMSKEGRTVFVVRITSLRSVSSFVA